MVTPTAHLMGRLLLPIHFGWVRRQGAVWTSKRLSPLWMTIPACCGASRVCWARMASARGYSPPPKRSLTTRRRKQPRAWSWTSTWAGFSGIELRRKLTASGSRLPVIFITALDDATTQQEAIAAGCVAFLSKPFGAKQLVGAVTSATG